jgi:hypothetical protein
MSTEIKEQNGAWWVTDELGMMMMSMKDHAVLDKQSLVMLKRSMSEAGTKVEIEFSGGKVTGTAKMEGQKAAIEMEIGGPVFGDGPGYAQVIACLPLAEGYTTAFRTFDLLKQKAKAMRLEVAGSEEIQVPAGTFDTFRVELKSATGGPERSTVWVSKGGRKAVKLSTMMPELAGAKLEAELT